MLVDLGRNDLGRIARTGSVQITQLMVIERYSHVMHIVSSLQAQLEEGLDAFDVLKAVFPAGTLTGAPKIRAMEIIAELEPVRRGPYGGAVGYFSFSGNMDLCITIRTILLKEGKMHIQAGAGIVADSDPRTEYQETVNKAAGMRQAVELAPLQPAYIDSLGWVYYRMGEHRKAAFYLERAIRHGGARNSAENYYHLGAAYARLGKLRLAARALLMALQYDPQYDQAITELRKLRYVLPRPMPV